MGIRLKLILLIAFVALVPLSVSAFTALRIHQKTLEDRLETLHARTAEYAADLAEAQIEHVTSSLSLLAGRTIQWSQLSASERDGALWLVYRQFNEIAAVTLLDEHGRGIGASAYIDRPRTDLAAHPIATMEVLQEFSRNIPFDDARVGEARVGRVFYAGAVPMIPVVVAVPGATGSHWVVAVALSLRGLCDDLGSRSQHGLELSLVDAADRIVCGPRPGDHLPEGLSLDHTRTGTELVRYTTTDQQEMIAAVTVLPVGTELRWVAIAQQPVAVAFATSHVLRQRTFLWLFVGLLAALAGGGIVAQGISRPIRELVIGAQQVASGNYGYRVTTTDRGELGELSNAFNRMSQEVESFSSELQSRVDAQTKELRDAQDALLRAQTMAAMTSLGAGMAHEINNPLTGLMGMTQLLLRKADTMDERDARMLHTIGEQARRIRDIVSTLQSLDRDGATGGFEPRSIPAILDSAVDSVRGRLHGARISVRKDYVSDLPRVNGDGDRLRQVFLHILDNCINVMRDGGRIDIRVSMLDRKLVKVEISDDGPGIDPDTLSRIFDPFFTTKANWEGKGLGLAVAFRIVEEHQGSIRADSKPGAGTTVTVLLPKAVQAHLE